MAEYIYVEQQTIAPNNNATLNERRGCGQGNIYHRDGSGVVILRGKVNNPCASFARYRIDYQTNIAIPTGGTATTPIGLAISIEGEADPASLAISTPGAVEQFNSVSGSTYVDVPRGCCWSIGLKNANASSDPTVVQQSLVAQNVNLVVTRVA